MRLRLSSILAIALLCLAPTASWADLAPYSQDFEGLDQANPDALGFFGGAGFLVFANVFNPGGGYLYGYGTFSAPNGTPGFCSVAAGEGGPDQGDQQLVVYSDYNNTDHALGNLIEANVFQEQIVGAADVGSTWLFEFDAKRGDIGGDTTALAFFKTLDPANGFALTNFIWVDTTNIPDTWGNYSLAISIDASLEGQVLQFGFLSTATLYENSGMLYDNINFRRAPIDVAFDVRPGSCVNPINSRSRGVIPAAILGAADLDVSTIDVASLQLEGVAPLMSAYDDVAAPFGGDLCGCTANGPDGLLDLTLKFNTQDLIEAIGPVDGGDLILTLTGTLLDGTPIEGRDCVIMVGGSGNTGMLDAAGADGTGTLDVQQVANPDADTIVAPAATRQGRQDASTLSSRSRDGAR